MSCRFPSLYSAVALSLVLVLSGACAPRLAVRPSNAAKPVSCADSIVAPMLDTVVSAAFATPLTILAAQKLSSKDRTESYETPMFITLGTLAAASGVAAFFGYRNASRCTKMKAQYTLCLNGDEPSCKALGVLANRKQERINTETPLLQPSTPVAQ